MIDADVPDTLRQLRSVLGLNKTQMAKVIGVSFWGVAHCEYSHCTGSHNSKMFAKIKQYLEDTGLQILAEARDKPFSGEFIEGHCYSIYSPLKSGNKYGSSWAFSAAAYERSYRFRYLRKDGKHHVFREINCGWTRTYTDAQLVGKKILEVT
mgnify:CR=1 FL=1